MPEFLHSQALFATLYLSAASGVLQDIQLINAFLSSLTVSVSDSVQQQVLWLLPKMVPLAFRLLEAIAIEVLNMAHVDSMS